MVKNYLVQADLEAYIPKLETLLYTNQDNFDLQKQQAEIEVMNDFIKRGFKAIYLRNDLILRESGTTISETTAESISLEDTITRMRWVIDTKVFTGTESKTIYLSGSNDAETYTAITEQEITETGITNVIISEFYKYYKVTCELSDGTIDYSSYLTETSYDLLYAFKWITIILTPIAKEINTPYWILLQSFIDKYNSEWNSLKIYYDSQGTGDISQLSTYNNNTVNLTR